MNDISQTVLAGALVGFGFLVVYVIVVLVSELFLAILAKFSNERGTA
jgi:hypothetical protein